MFSIWSVKDRVLKGRIIVIGAIYERIATVRAAAAGFKGWTIPSFKNKASCVSIHAVVRSGFHTADRGKDPGGRRARLILLASTILSSVSLICSL